MLSLAEYIMKEPLPLAVVHEAILDFCRDRTDLCVFGAHALNEHTKAPRMTQDVDIMAEEPAQAAKELAGFLAERFQNQIAARVRAVKRGNATLGYRIYQQRSEERGGNRHLADVRVLDIPAEHVIVRGGLQYTDALLTMAMKATAAAARSNQTKRLQDSADLARLMVAMPDVTADDLEPVWRELRAPSEAREIFEDLHRRGLRPETDEDSFY